MEIVYRRAENKKRYPNRLAPGVKRKGEKYQYRVSESSVFRGEIENQIQRKKSIKKK